MAHRYSFPFLLILTLFISGAARAEKSKDEQQPYATAGMFDYYGSFSHGKSSANISLGNESATVETRSANFELDWGYFPVDKFRIGFRLGASLDESETTDENSGAVSKEESNTLTVGGSLTYLVFDYKFDKTGRHIFLGPTAQINHRRVEVIEEVELDGDGLGYLFGLSIYEQLSEKAMTRFTVGYVTATQELTAKNGMVKVEGKSKIDGVLLSAALGFVF